MKGGLSKLELLKEARIDSLWLVTKLDREQIEEIMNYLKFQYSNNIWNKIYHNKEPFFMISCCPRLGEGKWIAKHYNIMIHLQHEAIKQKPLILKQIIQIGMPKWKIKRLDISFDWLVPVKKVFVLRHARTKVIKRKSNDNYYVYGNNNRLRIAVYDKKLQLKAKKNIEIPDESLTRTEIRIRPKLSGQPSSLDDLSWLKPFFNKTSLVPNVEQITRKLSKSDRDTFHSKIQRREQHQFQDVEDRAKRRIRQTIKQQKVDLDQIFEDKQLGNDIIVDWLK
jgi:hypothetical protein